MHSGHQNVFDLWRTDGLGGEIFRLSMSCKRFKFLLRNRSFDDREIEGRRQRKSLDKFYCMRETFYEFVRLCKENYSHSEYVTIDEMLPNFRGKSSFRVYMPNKPGKFGIKVWAMSDSKTFYTSNMEVFISKQKQGPYELNNSTRSIVNR
uniref:PiggyBac transposable element-derived protein domain-containing protein n=1 Tax=Clastoptera arizonana TaxID=38151 RepID=A0A1B6CG24_9HEMI